MPLDVLLPQQLQRHVPMALELLRGPRHSPAPPASAACLASPAPNTRPSSSALRQRLGLGRADPAARTARKYFETAPTESPSARAHCPHAQVARLQPAISCFNFDMEILSFGIDFAPSGQNPKVTRSASPINLQPLASSATIVNTFPRS